jgi:hypothetical protein
VKIDESLFNYFLKISERIESYKAGKFCLCKEMVPFIASNAPIYDKYFKNVVYFAHAIEKITFAHFLNLRKN